jgi:hypothetical protein
MRRLLPGAMRERVDRRAPNGDPIGQPVSRDGVRVGHARQGSGLVIPQKGPPALRSGLGVGQATCRGSTILRSALVEELLAECTPGCDRAKANAVSEWITHGVTAGPGLQGSCLFRFRLADSTFLLSELDPCGFQLMLDLGHIGGVDVGSGRLSVFGQ